MKIIREIVRIAVLLPLALPAFAETSAVSQGGFTITVVRQVAVSADRVFRALGEPGRWWSAAHTWSGNAANLSLDLSAGGCFCERWAQGSVEHGRVVYAQAGQQLRLLAPLGPLQSLPVNAVLTFTLAGSNDGTRVTVTYLVSGGGMDLSQLAGPVDGVITEQVNALAAYAAAR